MWLRKAELSSPIVEINEITLWLNFGRSLTKKIFFGTSEVFADAFIDANWFFFIANTFLRSSITKRCWNGFNPLIWYRSKNLSLKFGLTWFFYQNSFEILQLGFVKLAHRVHSSIYFSNVFAQLLARHPISNLLINPPSSHLYLDSYYLLKNAIAKLTVDSHVDWCANIDSSKNDNMLIFGSSKINLTSFQFTVIHKSDPTKNDL